MASLRHGIPRVQAEIHRHLLNLRRIRFHRRQATRHYFDLNALVDDLVEEARQTLHDPVQIHGAWLQRLAPCEGQEFLGQRRRAIRLFTNARKTLRNFRIAAALLLTQLRPAEDGPDDVVEIVRNAPGKLPDRFKLLCLEQLPLQRSKFGYVFHDAFQRIRRAR